MKLQIMSDLHLEFEPTFRPTNNGSDVLILAGDICVAERFQRNEPSPFVATCDKWRDFFRHCSENWDHVIYIMGNHEHYHGYFDWTLKILQGQLLEFENIYVVDQEKVTIGGYDFLCGTMWTDFNKGSPIAESVVTNGLNDYRLIRWSKTYWKIKAVDTKFAFQNMIHFIKENYESENPVIVVTHHAPSELSVHSKYKGEQLNYGYFSNLEDFIMDRPNIKLWAHGHTHTCHDYMVGDTRVVCNPRGYNDENPNFDQGKVFEV